MIELTAEQIAEAVSGEVRGDQEVRISGVGALETAQPHELSFVANPKYLPYLHDTLAGAVLVPRSLSESVPDRGTYVLVEDAHIAMYHALHRLFPKQSAEPNVHPTAVVDETVKVEEGAVIGPLAVVEKGARIGARAVIGAHAFVGANCDVGDECTIHPHATVHHGVVIGARCIIHSGARIGREGFGFVWLNGGHRRVPQVGGCILGDDVEVGANSTIDRGSIGDTVIGAGTKIDNLVHLGHNVKVGSHVIVIAQVGVSGSTTIGDGAILAGQAGVGGHLSIGARARIGGQAGVTADVPAGETYSGYPARPHREAMRAQGAMFKLPDLMRRVKALEAAVGSKTPGTGKDESK